MKEITMIKTSDLRPHPKNPRRDLGDYSELAESIKKNGIMQNLTVVPAEDGSFYTVIGNRRAAAALKAGLDEVPCVIADDMSEAEQISVMLEENMQRNDLSISEQAHGFQMLLDLGETKTQIAKRSGLSRSTIDRRLELAKLDGEALDKAVGEYQLTLDDLQALEKLEDPEERNEALKGADSKWTLVNRVRNILQRKERDEAEIKIRMACEGSGIKKGTGENAYQGWGGKCDVLARYDLRYLPEKIEIDADGAKVFYYFEEYSKTVIFYTIRTDEDKDRDEEEREAKRESIRITTARLQMIKKALDEEMLLFVQGLATGKFKIPKKEEAEAWERIWPVIEAGLEEYRYGLSIDEFLLEAGAEDPSQLIRAYVAGFESVEGVNTWRWDGTPDEDAIGMLDDFICAIMPIGYKPMVEDTEKLLKADSDLYAKEVI